MLLLLHDGRGFAEEKLERFEFFDESAVLRLEDGDSGLEEHLVSSLLFAPFSVKITWRRENK